MQSIARTARLCLLIGVLAMMGQGLLLSLPAAAMPMPGHTSMVMLHLLLELFAVVVAALIATVSWHTFSDRSDRHLPLLIGGFLVIGACDLLHALTYEGMPPLLGEANTPRAIFFWLMGRSVEVLLLALIAVGRVPRLSRGGALLLGLLIALALVAWGSWGLEWFPATFEPGQGVTDFKAGYELVLCAANLLVAWRLWRRGRASGQASLLLLATSAWVMGIGALAFTSYQQPSDLQNIGGHAYKIAAYLLLYWATYLASLRAPFEAAQAAERRASESEQRLRALSDNLPDTIIYQIAQERDGSMRFLHISQALERVLGVSPEAALRDPTLLYSRIHPEDQGAMRDAERASMIGMSVFDVTVRMHRSDGGERWMRMISAPRRLDDGRICWDGVQTDITESRNALLQLRESESTLASVVNSASDAVISCDLQGRIRLFNPAAERIFGHPAGALIGQGLDRLLPSRTRASHGGHLVRFAASAVSSRGMGPGRVQGLHADGSELELEASISQVRVSGQTVLTAILRDVTERARTERALLKYQLELTELTHQLIAQEKATSSRLAQVLHDQLGQTLTAMRIDFVSEAHLPLPADAARHARVDRLIDQAIREIRQVLVELRPTLLDEQGLLEALDNELRSRRQVAGPVQLRLEAAPAMSGRRWGSEVEYAAFMVAREAVANALAHAGASEICVRLEGGISWLRLEIADNGRGLSDGATSTRPGHLGMVGMRERSIAIGGQFEIGNGPDGGTIVTLSWEDPRE